jgi:hypothetical protein
MLVRLSLLLALTLWLVAWGRLASAAVSQPPPWDAWTVGLVDAAPGALLRCTGHVIEEGDGLWRFPCRYPSAEGAPAVALARFDTTAAAAHQVWPLHDRFAASEADPTLFAFAHDAEIGLSLVGVTGRDVALATYLVSDTGAIVTQPELPFSDSAQVLGLAWTDTLTTEWVYAEFFDEEVSLAPLFGMGEGDAGEGEADGDDSADAEADPSPTDAEAATPTAPPSGEDDAAGEADADEDQGAGEATEDGDGEGEGDGFFLPPLRVPRATLYIIRTEGDGETQVREVADPACSDDYTACTPELAYWDGEEWRFVYLRYSAVARNVTDVSAEIVEGTEAEAPYKTGEVSLEATTHCFVTGGFEDPLLRWLTKPLDYSRSNITARSACLPLHRLQGEVWTPLPLPQSEAGISYDIPITTGYAVNADDQLIALAVANPLREPGRLIYHEDGWAALRYTPDGALLLDGADLPNNAGVLGAPPLAGDQPELPAIAPAGDGGLWLMSARGDYARLDSDLNRRQAPDLGERLSRFFDGNFALLRGTNTVYGDASLPKRLTPFWVLLGLPLALLTAALVWRARKARAPFPESAPAFVAALIYIAGVLVLAGWFWSMTGLL